MKRKEFIRKTLLAAGSTIVAPYILPSGRLFAATGQRLVNHVVLALFAGGVRNKESVHMNDGNLMPHLLNGSGGISSDIAGGIDAIGQVALGYTLQSKGTLFKEFRYKDGPTGHFNGHTVAITGAYTDTGLNLRNYPTQPTVFEYYRKHNSPAQTALKSWWVSNSLGAYPYLNYSRHPEYGPDYGANFIAPLSLFSTSGYNALGNPAQFSTNQQALISRMQQFFNGNFQKDGGTAAGIVNTEADRKKLAEFITDIFQRYTTGSITPMLPWNQMNGDLLNMQFAGEIINAFNPELLVVNMTNIDACHTNFTDYANNIHKADYAMAWLWNLIQTTPGMKDDTILIVVPEHGRNAKPNNLVDKYGRFGLDHTNDDSSREIFCMLVGPENRAVVKSNQVITNVLGESIDVVPTINHILGYQSNVPAGLLNGRVLTEAFV